MALHAYICECESRRCKRKMYLESHEYDYLASIGGVQHIDHFDANLSGGRAIRSAFARSTASPLRPSRPTRPSGDGQVGPGNGSATGLAMQPERKPHIGVNPFND